MRKFMFFLSFSVLSSHVGLAAEPVRGVVRAIDQAVITTELNARVLRVMRKEGETFAKGDLLIEFDCEKYRADLRAARAEEKLNLSNYQNSVELERRHAVGTLEVVQNGARVEKAKAISDGLVVKVQECEIKAPFSGTMADVHIHPNETSVPNQPLFKIFDSNNVEIELIVPSNYLAWLRPGATFSAHIDETGEDVDAKVTRVSAAVDPVSQTVKIMGAFTSNKGESKQGNILPGMSLTAKFERAGN